jgi:hypothetical protein
MPSTASGFDFAPRRRAYSAPFPGMQVSSNIVRFPQPAAPVSAHRVEKPAEGQAHDNIVAFTPPERDGRVSLTAQEHGQLFAAHRIVARVADQLDRTASL